MLQKTFRRLIQTVCDEVKEKKKKEEKVICTLLGLLRFLKSSPVS